MKAVILAGGLGTRLAEYTKLIPKPMVRIGKKPILIHIMEIYNRFGVSDFLILTGYKSNVISDYFKDLNYYHKILDKKNEECFLNTKSKIKISLIYTGHSSKTGLRLKKIQKFFKKDEDFYLTYGDGLANINLNKLYSYHKSKKSHLTISAVRPPARFGEVVFKGNKIISFQEKNTINSGWINGGYMVINSIFFEYLSNKNQMLEREPFNLCLKKQKMHAYKHFGF